MHYPTAMMGAHRRAGSAGGAAPGLAFLWCLAAATSLGSASAQAADPAQAASEAWTRAALLDAFADQRLAPVNRRHLLTPGAFPELRWQQPFLVREVWGALPLRVQWFDAAGQPVETAARAGRYGAYIEGTAPGGRLIRRAMTFYCFDPATVTTAGPAAGAVELDLPLRRFPGVTDAMVAAHGHLLHEFARRSIFDALVREEEGAILIAGLAEWQDQGAVASPVDDPYIRHQEYHLRIKRRLLGVEDAYPPLAPPGRRSPPAPALTEIGSTAAAGFRADLPQRLRVLCQRWLDETNEPFTIVVARRGVMVFHEAYGARAGTPVTHDTTYPMFSISKSVTGLLLARFLDQGLLELDAPLGRVLPDLPVEGADAITVRRCVMHVTGLDGHGRWGGLNNPWLENVVANTLETVTPGYRYAGVPYDLVGMAMQVITGHNAQRLFHEHLFEPLEMRGASIDDLGTGAKMRAIDLARLGQLLLNGGAYGEHALFSEQTARQLLPRPYEEIFEDLGRGQAPYGLGIRWAGEAHPDAGTRDRPAGATIFSPRTVGHGSFSGSIFRVDLEQQIVLAVGRFNAGERHGQYLRELMMLVREAVSDAAP